MGYACPVCGDPQRDAEHLANHLAFTAMLGHEDHEAWLDDHASEWESLDPETLGARVTEYAPEEEFPQLFEDTTDRHDHGRERPQRFEESIPRQRGREAASSDTSEVLAEAEAMTREMLRESDEE
jgi:hypothetical protein